ncbi:MAG TPA: alkaline phosphatase family protein [Ramlibacter sp.]|nr:alkaline phosphatase family protein [Ramlibacter sp.]
MEQLQRTRPRNVLFIMCDQLRWDYLSCYGHRVLQTPHIDALARRGVRFDRAYVQSAVCVPSRMSFYTGRYVASHGTTWNYVPLSVAQVTLGDHLRRAGRSAVLAGKTHVIPDRQGLARLGIDPDSDPGRLILGGGFHQLDRYDGHAPPGPESGYADYLRGHGYGGDDPWNEHVVAALDERGERVSGWHCRNAHLPARVREEHSETAYMTDRAIDFVRQQGEAPWVLHLSYIKPHWPLMAPAPYHAMYRESDTGAIIGGDPRTENAHPVLQAYRQAHEDCVSHQDPAFVRHVRPAYMGLIKQVDDHLGRLFAELERLGRIDDTLIVFTSDHGDHLGDHGLGEKELFYEQAVRVPMIVVDPSAAADATRGSADSRMVEAIDIVPTILDALGLAPAPHLVEGRSLLPLLHGAAVPDWRDCAFSELDYAFRGARTHLGRAPGECHAWMARTERWKYVQYQGLRPQLFDLESDPLELVDRGDDPQLAGVQREMRDRIADWQLGLKRRTGVDHDYIASHTEYQRQANVLIGVW